MKVKIARSIREFSPEEWDSVSLDPTYSASAHRWLSFVESNARFYRVIYILVSDNAGPYARLTVTDLGPNSTFLQRLIGRKALLLIAPFSAGPGGLVFRVGLDLQEGLSVIDPILRDLCKRERRLLLAVANVRAQDCEVYRRSGFFVTSAPSNTVMEIPPSYQEYFDSLTRESRGELRRMARRAAERGVTFERTTSLKDHSAELYDLLCEVYTRHGALPKNIDFGEELFGNLEEAFGNSVALFKATVGGQLGGYLITLQIEDLLACLFVGLRYDIARPTYIYFLLFERIISWAIENKIRLMVGGITMISQKQRVGFKRESQFLCYRANNRILNEALAPLNAAMERHIVNAGGLADD